MASTRARAARSAVQAAVRSVVSPTAALSSLGREPRDGLHEPRIESIHGGARRARVANVDHVVSRDTRAPIDARTTGTGRGLSGLAGASRARATTAPPPRHASMPRAPASMAKLQHPVRIYSTPSRTVMVGTLAEVARMLDISIERERARLAPQS
ncbi:hypothetical protein [Pararobbsia silviterrae]|nr:hypothetical protein [Pararobbsia silviterrae]